MSHQVPTLPPSCGHPAPTKGHLHVGTSRGLASFPFIRRAASQGSGGHSRRGQPVHMAGDTGMAGKVALLLWAQTLGLAGAQTTQLLVEPPWRPAVLWDRVTLTCQGSETAGATTWYKDGQRWGQQGQDHITVTESGTYTCDRPGSGHSRHVKVLDVVAGIGWALLFLVLLVGVIVAWHRWHRVAARKHQERPSPEPLATPEEGEILYTHVVSTKQAQRPSCITVPQERQVTYTELPGLHGRPFMATASRGRCRERSRPAGGAAGKDPGQQGALQGALPASRGRCRERARPAGGAAGKDPGQQGALQGALPASRGRCRERSRPEWGAPLELALAQQLWEC
ncbi:uncharacterized protein [Taeniopygia guttata]|uniref:uncharacterized protein n=1 Tax=Taeniopygia guttata TaxID=59729 RepID=UPI003BB8A92A